MSEHARTGTERISPNCWSDCFQCAGTVLLLLLLWFQHDINEQKDLLRIINYLVVVEVLTTLGG